MNILSESEVRVATSSDIGAMRAQLRECTAMQVAALGGLAFKSQLDLANALEKRAIELEKQIKVAESGAALELHASGGATVPSY